MKRLGTARLPLMASFPGPPPPLIVLFPLCRQASSHQSNMNLIYPYSPLVKYLYSAFRPHLLAELECSLDRPPCISILYALSFLREPFLLRTCIIQTQGWLTRGASNLSLRKPTESKFLPGNTLLLVATRHLGVQGGACGWSLSSELVFHSTLHTQGIG